jgi:hypothetical protein
MNYNYNIPNVNFNGTHGVKNMTGKDKSFQDYVDEMVEKVADRAEKEVPEYGEFTSVTEYMPNPEPSDPVSKYALSVLKMPKDVVSDPKQRYIQATAYIQNSDYKATMLIGAGHKEKIMQILNNPKFPEKLNQTYGKLLDAIEDN